MEAEEFRAALERALTAAQADERVAPLLCATRMRMRLVCPDTGLELNLAASPEDERIEWSFEAVGWEPQLVLEMPTEVAHRYLLGQQSLAIAVARGQVKVRGDSRAALAHLPATRLICDLYRGVVEGGSPRVAAA